VNAQLYSLLVGAFLASLLHAVMPTHWLPFVLMGRARRWGMVRTLQVTALGGTCHILVTCLLGAGLVYVSAQAGWDPEHKGGVPENLASILLLAVGAIYVILHFVLRGHHHHHFPIAASVDHPHTADEHTGEHGHRLAEGATIGTLIAVMTLSPCEAAIPIFLPAAVFGWWGVGLLAAVLLVVTVGGMLVLVTLGHRGIELVKSEFIEHNERLLLGVILVILGVAGLLLGH
jgi:nickel/cobalt exporter